MPYKCTRGFEVGFGGRYLSNTLYPDFWPSFACCKSDWFNSWQWPLCQLGSEYTPTWWRFISPITVRCTKLLVFYLGEGQKSLYDTALPRLFARSSGPLQAKLTMGRAFPTWQETYNIHSVLKNVGSRRKSPRVRSSTSIGEAIRRRSLPGQRPRRWSCC